LGNREKFLSLNNRASGALLGLIGSPISSSASPALHEAAAAALGIRCFYQLIEVEGADRETLRLLLDGVRRLGFAGVNVTYPYKEAVLPLLDDVSPAAAAVGAVNTIVVQGTRLVGHNTDTSGFGRACAAAGLALDRPVALVGAGGVGKAVALALAERGVPELRVFDRDAARGAALAEAMRSRLPVRACATVGAAVLGAGGIVNATPVGMLPNRDTPVPVDLLHRDLWVADAVYTPLWTPLLEAARVRGARVMTGRDLVVEQALDAFRLFTGAEPSRDVMNAAFEAVLKKRALRPQAA